jgi:hypothetical protein
MVVEIYITWGASHFPYLSSTYLSYNQNVNFGALYRNVKELRQMEEAASAQRREIENNPRQNDTNLISTDIHLDKVRKRSWSWAV